MTEAAWSAPAYALIARRVQARTGLNFTPTFRERAEAGIDRAMARAGCGDLASYVDLLESRGAVLDDLVVELAVGETYFFREPGHFEVVRRLIVPEVCERGGPAHVLRAWSAGCASGEEAYSLAIVLDELGHDASARVLGTDISRLALAKARAGTYGAWSLRGDDGLHARPYLARAGDRYVVADALRRRVSFEYVNLVLDTYPSYASGLWAMDLVFCRNVLIYFDAETVARVARRLFDTLAPGGWLVTASSDPSLVNAAPFEAVTTEAGVVYRRGPAPATAAATPPERPARASLAPARPPRRPRAAVAPAARKRARGGPARSASSDAEASALQVRALANLDSAAAERACAAAAVRHPLSAELHYLRALLLSELGRDAEAVQATRCVLYLDASLAAAHLTLGTVLRRLGDREGARRAYATARELSAARPPDEVVPLTDGERAGRLLEAAEMQLALLDAPGSRP
jgi:chemotaxis protein methyltransferase CheR